MTFLFTILRYWPAVGGAETQLRELANALADDHTVTVATQTTAQHITDPLKQTTVHAPVRSVYQDGKVTVHVIHPNRSARWALWPMLKLASIESTKQLGFRLYAAALEDPLLQLAHGADVMYNALVGTEYYSALSWRVARRLGIPFVIRPMVHPGSWGDSPFLLDLYRRADAVLALLESEKKFYVSSGVPEERIHVVGIFPLIAGTTDGAAFRARYGIRGRMVLFIGRKVPYKGYQTLLAAAPLVWARHPDVTFVCIGPEEGESASGVTMAHTSDPRILLIGAVSEQEKADAFAACDIFCLPSRHEIFPSVILEAWHFAKPVIAGDIPYLRELVGDGECGYIVEQYPEQLADRILALLDHPERMREYGARGRQKLTAHYTKEAVVQRTLQVFERVVRFHHSESVTRERATGSKVMER